MKRIALVPLAALSIVTVAVSQDWVRPRLDAQLGWDPRSGFDFDLNVAIELPLGLAL
ncbi:MAG TPA: hypothetical protein VF605_03060 [Allosphingosinicella sp.]|jgi:hypothetical protein